MLWHAFFMEYSMRLLSILATLFLLTACQPPGPGPGEHGPGFEGGMPPPMPAPLKIKAVVVTMFEMGEDTGDKPGEFQFWRERYGLSERFAFPQSFHDIYFNRDKGVLGIVTGMGISRASSAIMALGLDPRFDLTQAYLDIPNRVEKDRGPNQGCWKTYSRPQNNPPQNNPRTTLNQCPCKVESSHPV